MAHDDSTREHPHADRVGPRPRAARKQDGTFDQAAAKAGMEHWLGLIVSGQLTIADMDNHINPHGRVHFTFDGDLSADALKALQSGNLTPATPVTIQPVAPAGDAA